MSDSNNIDDLFKSKLAGREVAYSASAWAGASQLIDKHFRLLFLKKLLLFGLPLLFCLGAATFYFIQDEAAVAGHRIESGMIEPSNNAIGSVAAIAPSPAKSSAKSATSTLAPQPKEVEMESLVRVANVAKKEPLTNPTYESGNAAPKSTDSKATVAINTNEAGETTDQTNDIVDAEQTDPIQPNEIIDATQPRNARSTLKSEMVSTEVASILLNSNLDRMEIRSLEYGAFNSAAALLNDESIEPAMKKLRKTQVYAEVGLLAAQGYHDLNAERLGVGIGAHARVLAKYHLGQSVYLDLGLGFFNRNSVTKGKAVSGAEPGSTLEVTPMALNYGSILVGTGYRIGMRHAFGGGFQLNPLLAVISKEEKTIAGEKVSTMYTGDKTGFAGLDASFVINHRLTLKERLDVCTELHCGIFDATDNAVFKSGDVNDFNTAIKVGISYRLTGR